MKPHDERPPLSSKPGQLPAMLPAETPNSSRLTPVTRASSLECSPLQENSDSPISSPLAIVPTIYAVDDEPGLTELYRIVLEEAGYRARVFNNRSLALA